jgi:hypothetical protein
MSALLITSRIPVTPLPHHVICAAPCIALWRNFLTFFFPHLAPLSNCLLSFYCKFIEREIRLSVRPSSSQPQNPKPLSIRKFLWF